MQMYITTACFSKELKKAVAVSRGKSQEHPRNSGLIFPEPLSFPENAQTLAGTASYPGKSGRTFPGLSKLPRKLVPKRLWNSHSLLKFSELPPCERFATSTSQQTRSCCEAYRRRDGCCCHRRSQSIWCRNLSGSACDDCHCGANPQEPEVLEIRQWNAPIRKKLDHNHTVT